MLTIINSSNETLAILQNVVSPVISEALNREYTFDFSTVLDGDKSQHIALGNKVEVEGDYFNVIYFRKNRDLDSITIDVSCEHVSYDLISANFTAGFTATGLFSAVATTLLSGTGFTVGTVEVTGNETISINESTNAFRVLKQLASLYSGELKFDKYQISLLTRRGADRGVQFRYRKNISNATVIVDGRQKTAGVPKIAYEISPAELEFEQSFIADGVSSLEHYELGDTIRVIDEDLGIDASLRIVKESHDTEQRMMGTVEISNFVDDLTDTLTQIQTTSVAKDKIYNGVSIGPDNGFVAERSDQLVKTSMNATNGIAIDMRDTTTASYTSVFYVQADTATGTVNLYLVGNAVFTGTVEASDIIGGTITIGTGSDTFNANGTDGIWLGATALATAPFSVTLSGSATADNLLLTGGVITIGTSNNTFRFNETDGLWIGNTVFASAPFKVTMSGSVTATDITMTGNSTITGATITGGTLQTATSGNRVVITGNIITIYDSSGVKSITIDSSSVPPKINYYDAGVLKASIYHIGGNFTIAGSTGTSLTDLTSMTVGTGSVPLNITGTVKIRSATDALDSLTQADSTATTVAEMVADFNALLAKQRSMNILA